MIARLRHIIDFFKDSKNGSPNGSPSGYASNSHTDNEGRTASPAGGYKTVPDSPILSRLSGLHGSRDTLFRDTSGGFGVVGSGISLDRKTGHSRLKDDLDDSYNSTTEGDYLSAVSDYNPRSRESSYFSASEGRTFSPLWMSNKNSHDTDIYSQFTDSQATTPQMSSGFTSPTYRPFESPNYFSADEQPSDSTIGRELGRIKNKADTMSLLTPEYEKPKIKLSKFFTEFKHIEPHVNLESPNKTVRFEDEVIKDQPKIVKPSASITSFPTDQNYELPKGPEATSSFEKTMTSSNGHSFIPFSVATRGENNNSSEVLPTSRESGPHLPVVEETSKEKVESHNQQMLSESQPTSETNVKTEAQLYPELKPVSNESNLSLPPTTTVSEAQQKALLEQKDEVTKKEPEAIELTEHPIIKESDDLLADLESLIAFNDSLKRSLLLGEKPSSNPLNTAPPKEKTDTADSPSEVKQKDMQKVMITIKTLVRLGAILDWQKGASNVTVF